MIAQTRGAVNAGRRARGRPGNRKPRVLAAFVGADSISARFAAARTPAGGINPAPTADGGSAANRENHSPRVITNLCRGRCSHRPGDPAAPQTPAGGINPSPTNHGKRPAKRDSHTPPGGRRAGCPHPAGPAPPQTPAGGINPSPTNHGKRPAKRDGHNPPGGRRAGCPHPAGPRRAANTCGRIWNPPLRWVPRIGNMRCSRLARNTQNDCRAGCPHPAGPAARRPENRPPRCALPVSPPISSPACHLSQRAV